MVELHGLFIYFYFFLQYYHELSKYKEGQEILYPSTMTTWFGQKPEKSYLL